MSFSPLLALKASAGSGKTFALVARYLTLLFLGAKPSEILTLTFTKKAAKEMRDRILSALLMLSQNPKDATILLDELEKNSISREFVSTNASKIYREFINSNLKITTIDSFISSILKKFVFYAGVSISYEIRADDKDVIKDRFFHTLDDSSFLDLVEFVYEDRRGSGSIIDSFYELYYYSDLIESKRADKNSSLLQLKKLEDSVMSRANMIKAAFFECEDLSNAAKKSLEFNTIYELLSKAKSWGGRESLKEYSYFKKCYKESLDEPFFELKELLSQYFKVKEKYIKESFLSFFESFRGARDGVLKSENYLNFDDVTNCVYSLLNRVDKEFFYFRLDDKIEHILLDEFQDTSVVQYEILKPLIDEIKSGIGKSFDRSFFYVGDIKQSIYRFRGSNSYLFDFASRQVELKELDKNYRSKEIIVSFINSIFLDKIDSYTPQIPKLEGGYVEVLESEDILESIKESVLNLKRKNIEYSDMAILCFTNSDVLDIYYNLLESIEGVSITIETNAKLINQQEVKAVVALLKYINSENRIYLCEFLALCGKNPTQSIEIDKNLKKLLPYDVIYYILKNFDLFSQNNYRLLEESFSFYEIGEFLEYLNLFDIEIPKEQQSGIKIMTIHKSKGLEFEHLIVADRRGAYRRSSGRFLKKFSEDGVYFSDIFVRFQTRENYDLEYRRALELESELIKSDRLNLLYVALTRAKSSLTILKAQKSSEFELLFIVPLKVGEIESCVKKIDINLPIKKAKVEIESYGIQSDFLTLLAPSFANIESANFGLATHLAFELFDFQKDSIDMVLDVVENRYGILLQDSMLELIEEILERSLRNKELLELIDGGELYKEVPFLYDNKIGRVDLLIEKESEIYIVDFKTSKELRRDFEIQVSNYKRAFAAISGKKCRAFLYFVGEKDRLVELQKRQMLLFE